MDALPCPGRTAWLLLAHQPDSTEAEVGIRGESSFTYIEGSPEGWGQGVLAV